MKFPNESHLSLGKFLKGYSDEIASGFNSIDLDQLEAISKLMNETIINEDKIFCCGNGGSSAISEHFVCDFLKGASTDTSIQPIIHSFTSNVPTLTAVANDIDYEEIFSYQLSKYASEGDILICISSSGNSGNIIRVLDEARKMGVKSISFVGFDGGRAKSLSDYSIHVNNQNYGIVEDVHQSLMHMLAQYLRLKNMNSNELINQKIF